MPVVLCNKSANGAIYETNMAGFTIFFKGGAKVIGKALTLASTTSSVTTSYLEVIFRVSIINDSSNDRRSLGNVIESYVPERISTKSMNLFSSLISL